ncbi:tetratricopeptide repeat protein [Coleofasciculus sp. FACHB-SPT9]|uniref:tetratricopeptide repeat protein n=1 Tax=Cyanophyceae TaxID=3028117 RepID=UPI001687C1FB|nr:tetratricopeptide repeat protein [Coleofasciculus sp. FACHB-SPT9]MBD1892719.1 tetratricopeptide repeat protein [Coleofasciculus sp. FACHB-SPT9]
MIRDRNLDLEDKNEIAYEDLLAAIEASEGILSILIAVCDDSSFREQIIARYEAELAPQTRSYRVKLARGEPSIRAAIAELVQKDEYLQNQGKAVLTITGAEQLYFLKLGAERSEQEVFFGYLQWTREGLREFPYPTVLWINNQILSNLSKKAPDFWSWRKGVFRFESKKTTLIPIKDIAPFRAFIDDSDLANKDDEDPYFLPIEDLQQLIQQIEQQRGTKDPNLAVLYSRIGNIYKRRVERGESQDYQKEQELAIEYFSRTIALEKELGLLTELATDLNNLAGLYYSQGRYSEAEPLYLQAIEIDKKSLPPDHPEIATSLNNLAELYRSQGRYSEAERLFLQAIEIDKKSLPPDYPGIATHLNNLAELYKSQGRYSEAEPLYLQAIEIDKKSLPPDHPEIAIDLNNLAGLYESQGRYNEAEPLYLQAIEIDKKSLPPDHPGIAIDLNNLALLYKSQGRYSEAEPLYLQAMDINKKSLPPDHPGIATSLNNLAGLYESQGRYNEAEPLYLQAIDIDKKSLPADHPRIATHLNNLANLYESQGRYSEAEPLYLQAIDILQKSLPADHPQIAIHLNNLALLYKSQGRYSEAEPLYLRALEISDRALGANHPQPVTIRENLERMRAEIASSNSHSANSS